MKKFLPLILALVMSLALAAPAFAESTPVPPSDAEEEDYGIMRSEERRVGKEC